MAWVTVVADDGRVMLRERVLAVQSRDEYFRRCLADRIGWAVVDAEPAEDASADAPEAVLAAPA